MGVWRRRRPAAPRRTVMDGSERTGEASGWGHHFVYAIIEVDPDLRKARSVDRRPPAPARARPLAAARSQPRPPPPSGSAERIRRADRLGSCRPAPAGGVRHAMLEVNAFALSKMSPT